jgi:GH25 family lysozyme M1 (1,4-beta-N-acetylmuramidase)
MTIYGVDVSAFQGKPDWPKIQAAGISFAFAKATQGTTYTASTWAFDQDGMLGLSGFLPGAYHFLSDSDDPAAQCRYFVGKLKSPEKMAIGLDIERWKDSAGKVHKPTAAQAKAWATEFRRLLPGHPLLGYVPHWYWEELGKPALTFVDALWASSYVSGSGTPAALFAKTAATQWASYGSRAVALLQYSASGHVAGVDGSVDVDAYQGTLEELAALTLVSVAPNQPPPPPVTGLPIPHPLLDVDGGRGKLTVMALQAATAWRLHVSTPVDGTLSKAFVRLLQLYLKVKVDGELGPETTRALQKKLGVPPDGEWGAGTTRALQRALNGGKF